MSVPAQMVWSVESPGSNRTMFTGMFGIPLDTGAMEVNVTPLSVVLKMRPTSSRMSCLFRSIGVTEDTMYVFIRSVGNTVAGAPRCVGSRGKSMELVLLIRWSGPPAPVDPRIDWLEFHDHGNVTQKVLGSKDPSRPM